MIKFSVVVPLYNKGSHVKRALDSVLSQTIQDFEVIVIDGGSNDNGPTIVENMAYEDQRIKLLQQEGTGVSEARNQGIRESKSDLISLLDADDEWMTNYLETILRLREKYPDAGLYVTSLKTEFIDNVLMDTDEELRKLVPNEGLLLSYFKISVGKDVSKRALFNTSAVTVPKKIFSEIGGFQAGFWWGEDTDMWGRIALKYPIAYSSQVCAINYQNVVNSASKRKKPIKIHPFVKTVKKDLNANEVPPEVIKDLEEYIKYIEMYTAKHNVESGDKILAFNLLIRTDIKLIYKKILIGAIISTIIENNFSNFKIFNILDPIS